MKTKEDDIIHSYIISGNYCNRLNAKKMISALADEIDDKMNSEPVGLFPQIPFDLYSFLFNGLKEEISSDLKDIITEQKESDDRLKMIFKVFFAENNLKRIARNDISDALLQDLQWIIDIAKEAQLKDTMGNSAMGILSWFYLHRIVDILPTLNKFHQKSFIRSIQKIFALYDAHLKKEKFPAIKMTKFKEAVLTSSKTFEFRKKNPYEQYFMERSVGLLPLIEQCADPKIVANLNPEDFVSFCAKKIFYPLIAKNPNIEHHYASFKDPDAEKLKDAIAYTDSMTLMLKKEILHGDLDKIFSTYDLLNMRFYSYIATKFSAMTLRNRLNGPQLDKSLPSLDIKVDVERLQDSKKDYRISLLDKADSRVFFMGLQTNDCSHIFSGYSAGPLYCLAAAYHPSAGFYIITKAHAYEEEKIVAQTFAYVNDDGDLVLNKIVKLQHEITDIDIQILLEIFANQIFESRNSINRVLLGTAKFQRDPEWDYHTYNYDREEQNSIKDPRYCMSFLEHVQETYNKELKQFPSLGLAYYCSYIFPDSKKQSVFALRPELKADKESMSSTGSLEVGASLGIFVEKNSFFAHSTVGPVEDNPNQLQTPRVCNKRLTKTF